MEYVKQARHGAADAAPVVASIDGERRRGRAPEAAQGRGAVKNMGEHVERRPLTPWEPYARALLFTNELVYVN